MMSTFAGKVLTTKSSFTISVYVYVKAFKDEPFASVFNIILFPLYVLKKKNHILFLFLIYCFIQIEFTYIYMNTNNMADRAEDMLRTCQKSRISLLKKNKKKQTIKI